MGPGGELGSFQGLFRGVSARVTTVWFSMSTACRSVGLREGEVPSSFTSAEGDPVVRLLGLAPDRGRNQDENEKHTAEIED